LDGLACSGKTVCVDFSGVHYDTAKHLSRYDALTGTEAHVAVYSNGEKRIPTRLRPKRR
jgi:hypothetical protein